MTTSLAKVYTRNLTKEEAKSIVKKELEKKERKITNSKTNSLSRTVLQMISIPFELYMLACWIRNIFILW